MWISPYFFFFFKYATSHLSLGEFLWSVHLCEESDDKPDVVYVLLRGNRAGKMNER